MIKNLLIAAFAAAVVAGISLAVAGADGLRGSLVGSVVVALFFAANPAILGPVVRAVPHLSLAFALTFFITKLVAIVALMVVLTDPDGVGAHLDLHALVGSVIAATILWIVLLVVEHRRARQPLYDLGP